MLKFEKLTTETVAIRAIVQRAWLQKPETFIYYQGGSLLEAILFLVGSMICDVVVLLCRSAVWAQPENKRSALVRPLPVYIKQISERQL